MTRSSIYEEFRDLLQEVPEAEEAIRNYRALKAKQAREDAKSCHTKRDGQQH